MIHPCALSGGISRRGFLGRSATGMIGATAGALAGVAISAGAAPAHAAPEPLPLDGRTPRGHVVLGHDLSTLQQLEDAGRRFSDGGKVLSVEQIVARHGATHVRLRLWVDPPIKYDDLPRVLAMARRSKAAGLALLLDLHYSDFWADPGHQTTPRRWRNEDLAALARTIRAYTCSVIEALAAQGTPVDVVQIGNEVTSGMLWPQGKIYPDTGLQRWAEFATLLKAGIAGAHDGQPAQHPLRSMVHIDRGGDNPGSRYFYDNILDQGVAFDLIGLSYYPWWHGPLSALRDNLIDLAPRYHKDIVVVETAYPWTLADGDSEPNIVNTQTQLLPAYPATPQGQLHYLRDLLSIVRQAAGQHGLGVVYWEPAWIPGVGWKPGTGDAWDNLTLFDRDGRTLPSIRCFES
jgi:arabinogalactan endo-1,4-beta-galactosidase